MLFFSYLKTKLFSNNVEEISSGQELIFGLRFFVMPTFSTFNGLETWSWSNGMLVDVHILVGFKIKSKKVSTIMNGKFKQIYVHISYVHSSFSLCLSSPYDQAVSW